MLVLKVVKLAKRLVVSSHVLTLKHKVRHRHITQKCLIREAAETAVSRLYIRVKLSVSVSVHERTRLNIRQVLWLLK